MILLLIAILHKDLVRLYVCLFVCLFVYLFIVFLCKQSTGYVSSTQLSYLFRRCEKIYIF